MPATDVQSPISSEQFTHDLKTFLFTRAYSSEAPLRMMMMMKLPILPCAEKLELVLSTAPKTSDNTENVCLKVRFVNGLT